MFLLCWAPRYVIACPFLLIILLVLRFIMETVLKMGILQFTTTVYWVRVVLFLFPFIHTMGLTMIVLMYLPTNNIFLVNPVIYVAMSKLVRNYVVNIFKNLCCHTENITGVTIIPDSR